MAKTPKKKENLKVVAEKSTEKKVNGKKSKEVKKDVEVKKKGAEMKKKEAQMKKEQEEKRKAQEEEMEFDMDEEESEDEVEETEVIQKNRRKRVKDAALALGLADVATLESADAKLDAEDDEEEDSMEEVEENPATEDAEQNLTSLNKNKDKQRALVSKEGVIYLGRIPHGFFEDQMKGFFSQFGTVTQLRLSRSKRTLRSRGYAFIQFESPEVAKIVQMAMDKYILCGKVLQCQLLEPEKVHERMFEGPRAKIGQVRIPAMADAAFRNREKTPELKIKRENRVTRRSELLQKRLRENGIDYELPAVYVAQKKVKVEKPSFKKIPDTAGEENENQEVAEKKKPVANKEKNTTEKNAEPAAMEKKGSKKTKIEKKKEDTTSEEEKEDEPVEKKKKKVVEKNTKESKTPKVEKTEKKKKTSKKKA